MEYSMNTALAKLIPPNRDRAQPQIRNARETGPRRRVGKTADWGDAWFRRGEELVMPLAQ